MISCSRTLLCVTLPHCTVRDVITERTRVPDVSVPVMVMAYVPAGVPGLPPPRPLPPPQATWKNKAAKSRQASASAVSFSLPFCFETRSTRVAANPISGRQRAQKSPVLLLDGKAPVVDGVVLTVRLAGVPGVVDLGLIEHAGASVGKGITAQVRATEPLNPPDAITFTVDVDDAPGLTVAGVDAEAESEKSEATMTNEHCLPRSALY